MFGKKVVIFEKHFVVGGLNSFYAKKSRKFDVGLHAVTNFPSENSGKTSPLLRACRQLRIPFESLSLYPQKQSTISFTEKSLKFNNDFEFFVNEIEKKFPNEKDNFHVLLRKMEDFDAYSPTVKEISTRKVLKETFECSLLSEMLLCPTCYYGSAQENDIDFATFTMLFDAIFKQGLARPDFGIRAILDTIIKKFEELGGKRLMNAGVQKLLCKNDVVKEILIDNGSVYTADQVISTCGILETEDLINCDKNSESSSEIGNFSIIESISIFEGKPSDFGWEDTIVFYNDGEKFRYQKPNSKVDLESGVICMPENYTNPSNKNITESRLRITNPANFDIWSGYNDERYKKEKKESELDMLDRALQHLPNGIKQKEIFTDNIKFKDTFTPRTIKRFTNKKNGALYGSPTKSRKGTTKLDNLYISGTDQGYIGIVGAMLGGIAVANNQILRRN